MFASVCMQLEKVSIVALDYELQNVITLNRLDELMLPELSDPKVNMTAIFQIKVRRSNWFRFLHENID